jgi:hypothetical protein
MDRDLAAAWRLHGELQLRSRPVVWNTILPEEFMRGESAVTQLDDGGGGAGEGEWPGRRLDVEWRWGTRRRRGWLLWSGAAESREKRGLTLARSSWSCPPPELDEEEWEKREEAREREASESELSRRSGADARSDAAPVDARPPLLRWRRNLSDLAAEEPVVVLPGVFANAAAAEGDGDGDDDALGLWAEAAARLSPSSSRHRLEQLGALGENTYWSAAPAAAPPRIAFIGSGVTGIASSNRGGGAAAADSGSGAATAVAVSF